MIRIGINAHLLSGRDGYRRAGIHHYIAQVLRHVEQTAELDYTIFTRFPEPWGRPDMHTIPTRWPTEKRSVRILWEQVAWPLGVRQQQVDLMHSMAFVTPLWSPCPAIVTVYDLSFLHFPERFPALQRFYLTSQTRRSCRAARRVVAISESGRDDIHRFFGVPLEKIGVVRPGVDTSYTPRPQSEIDTFRAQHSLPEKFVLHVGTLQPRKNIPTLIEAMAQLRSPTPLVLVGGKGWLYDEIFARVERLGLSGRVHFTGYVPDEELPLWYNAATLLAFPSVYEGFGMPVVEAMACGTPVVAANTSSIPEAAGEAALLFEPHDVAALANHIESVVGNPSLAVTMGERGRLQAQQFSWIRSGRDMTQIYKEEGNRKTEPSPTLL